jgi:hypothetical protein
MEVYILELIDTGQSRIEGSLSQKLKSASREEYADVTINKVQSLAALQLINLYRVSSLPGR